MKYIIFIFAVFLFASPLFAQNPSISYLMVDEAKSRLEIHGSFGTDSGSISIEDTTLGIISWSDSLITCNLPDSGKGAGGHVEVQTKHGMSNKRALSIISLRVDHPLWILQTIAGDTFFWICPYTDRWIVSWRMDISSRVSNLPSVIPFEASKTSTAFNSGMYWPWHDTSQSFQWGFSFGGIVNLIKSQIYFYREMLKFGSIDTVYIPLGIKFDTTGFITGYTDIHLVNPYDAPSDHQRTDSLYDQKILFPPGIKNSVRISATQSNSDLINIIGFDDNAIHFQAETILGSTTASLYSIDGRLLKRTKLDISSPGIFSIDVSQVRSHFAILVLQTGSGVITKKIFF